MVRLHFAGPLFNDNELAFNARIAEAIERFSYDVFLPQWDRFELGSDPEIVGTRAEAQAIFDLDRDNVLACDVLLCMLDGRVPDEGMAVELGLAYADRSHHRLDRYLIGYATQNRYFWGAGFNAMLTGALDEIYHDETTPLDRLRVIAEAV